MCSRDLGRSLAPGRACAQRTMVSAPQRERPRTGPSLSNRGLQRALAAGSAPRFLGGSLDAGVKAPAPTQAPTTAPATTPAGAAPTAGGATITSCSASQTTDLRKAIAEAKTLWLPPTIAALGKTPLDPTTDALLKAHFKTSAPASVKTILANYGKILTDVDATSAEYECESWSPWCAIGAAYTWCSSRTSHVCDAVFGTSSSMQVARTVVHETAHRQGLCKDIYCDANAADYKTMSASTAIANADTYAAFAGELTGRYIC